MKIENLILGSTIRDQITGFQGVATGKIEYISGCIQVLVQQAVDKDGKKQEPEWFDIQRCEQIGNSQVILDNEENPGFDFPAPKR